MKHRLIIIFMLLAAICLSACGKNTDTSDIEETTPVESTEDPFSLGGIEDVYKRQPQRQSNFPKAKGAQPCTNKTFQQLSTLTSQ